MDICYVIDEEDIPDEDVPQEVLDICNCKKPEPPSCGFMPDPFFDEDEGGCVVWDDSYGYLGNVNEDCPSNVYLQQALCMYMETTVYDLPGGFTNPFTRPAYPQDPLPPKVWNNNFTYTGDDTTNRSVLVLGSSILSTHFQANNGKMCEIGSAARRETTYDFRGMPGNNFLASPAYQVPWTRAWAGARTGFNSFAVTGAGPGEQDACGTAWGFPASPMNEGFEWLKNQTNPLVITDGGLINDLQSTKGGWSETVKAIVACQAMSEAVPFINKWIVKVWSEENKGSFSKDGSKIKIKGQWYDAVAPSMKVDKSLAGGNWQDALDVPANQQAARCRFAVDVVGNGTMVGITKGMNSLAEVGMDIPALIPLKDGVGQNLQTIKAKFRNTSKQIWLQYPHMDQAMVTVNVDDIAIFWGGQIAKDLIDVFGANKTITIGAIDPLLQKRVAKVSDDLNAFMYTTIGCGAYVQGHGPVVCESDGNKPMVVITRDGYPGWNFQDHQSTIAGGMPHESMAGTVILGNGLSEANGLAAPGP